MTLQQRVMEKIAALQKLMTRDGLDGLVITNNIDISAKRCFCCTRGG